MSLSFYLLVMIAQKRNEFIYKSNVVNMQHLTTIYDEYTSSFMQLLKVMSSQSQDHQQFSRILCEQSLK